MSFLRLRTPALLLAAGLGLSACAYDGYGGYGYGRVSAGYCDPYWDDCYGSSYYDPWYGWYGDYYYPGYGIYVYDRYRRPHRWNDDHRRYWESRRSRWGERDWNDRRWERWDGWDRGGDRDWRRDGDRRRRDWRRDRSSSQQFDENPQSFRRDSTIGSRPAPVYRPEAAVRERREPSFRSEGRRESHPERSGHSGSRRTSNEREE